MENDVGHGAPPKVRFLPHLTRIVLSNLAYCEGHVARNIIYDNIELEVSLRQRALEAAQAKIIWAETMRKALVQKVQASSEYPSST